MKILIEDALEKVKREFPKANCVSVIVEMQRMSHLEENTLTWKLYSASLDNGWTDEFPTFEEAFESMKSMLGTKVSSRFVETD